MNKPMRADQRVVFGVSQDADDAILVLLQVPPGGWEYMKDGTCHTFDLTKAGYPIKILLSGCESRADAMRILEEANRQSQSATLHMAGTDFGIKDSKP